MLSCIALALAAAAGCGDAKREPATTPQSLTWRAGAALTCVQTELSPATLFHTQSNYIAFFTHLQKYGRGAPSYMALSGKSGPRAFKNGESLDAPHMEENWVMVWFAGARGWNRDSPWVVYLQRKPRSLRLDSNGLHFYFAAAAGDIVLLPLYGNYAAHGAGAESEEEFGGKQVKTWEWAEVLPREPLMRIRYWASALREFPTHCEDTRDGLTIRQKISWHSIRDDWGTKPLRLNPVSPTLAARSKDRTFPVKFSRPVMDLEMPTLYGPYMAAEGEAALEATFSNVITNGGTWKEWRQASGAKAHLVQMIEAAPGEWPRIALGQQWVIGEVIVSDDQAPGRTERVPINRNTEAVLCFP